MVTHCLFKAVAMTLQNNPAAFPFGAVALICATLALFAWRRRAMPAAPSFALMTAGEAIWALGESLELSVIELPVKVIGYAVRATGAMAAMVGLLAFVLRFTGRAEWLRTRWFAAACAPAVAFTILAWTNPWHSLFWSTIWIESMDQYLIAMHDYGPGFWACLAYCYAVTGLSSLLLGQAVVRSKGIYRDQAAIMLFGVFVPWIVSIIDMSHVLGEIYIDLVVISFAATGFAFLPALFRYRLLDLAPVAWEVVVNGMHDPVVVVDAWGRIAELNPAAHLLVDRLGPGAIGAEAGQAFRKWPALAQQLERIKEDGETTFEIDGPDPALPARINGRISRFGGRAGPSGWVLVLRDVTAHTQAEAERVRMLRAQAARAEAEAASQAKDRFLATLSHELRTPLTPVLATVTAMLDDPETAESLKPVLEMIRRNVVLETRLIDDLLDLSRIRQGKLHLDRQTIDAHDLIDRVIEICWDDVQSADLQLRTKLAASMHWLDADPVRLQQVLWNLIKNAIKFTPSGGTVTIRSSNSDAAANGPGQDHAPGSLLIEVSDTGVGIEPELLPRIFDMFEQGSQVPQRHGGLGLGLTIGRSIAEQHGGRLTAASAGAGCGATFTLELPVVRAPVVPSPAEAIPPAPAAAVACPRSLNILLVEDNPDTLKYLSRLLGQRGHVVFAAATLAEARLVASQNEIDLLISDIGLADGTGFELMWLVRMRRDVPGIALSGFGSDEDIELSRAAGFALHLTKPVEFSRLEQAIQQLATGTQAGSLIES
jgi:signal transduction histidine kinase/ActR/RegA family two-component response regulator